MSQQWLKVKIPETPKPFVVPPEIKEDKPFSATSMGLGAGLANNSRKSLGAKRRRKRRGMLGRGPKGGLGRTESVPQLPRDLNTNAIVGQTMRFGATADFAGNITLANIIGSCGTIGTATNTTVFAIASSVRIRHLRIFPPAEAGSIRPQLNSVTWASASGLAETKDVVRDASMPYGVSVGTVVSSRPPPRSLSSMWLNPQIISTSTVLCALTVEQGAIVEVDVSFTLANNLPTISIAASTVVIGNTYYLYLDGQSSHLLKPVGRPSTI